MQDTIFSFAIRATTEWFLQATMTYDHYVAICKPLLYAVNMINRLCNRLLLLSFLGSLVHAILHHVFKFRLCVLVAQLCLTFCDPMDCSLPGRIHGILQARILEWVSIPSCRGSSHPRDQTWVSHIAGGFFTT